MNDLNQKVLAEVFRPSEVLYVRKRTSLFQQRAKKKAIRGLPYGRKYR